MTILQGNKRFIESTFTKESDFEDLVRSHSKVLFGQDTIFLPKLKLKGLVLGNTIPDGFLFDLTELRSPRFYLVEFELQDHNFDRHILPQVTKFFGFFHDLASQHKLVDKLFKSIESDIALKNEFKKYLGDQEIFKFLQDICKTSQNVLLVIDGENKELNENIRISADWRKFVREPIVVKKFGSETEVLITVKPDF